ncbi:MAG: hypothetical protein H6825_01320 [Planctomycetes bacterium]|nr:hypothetical protein [Planctomycetota bacterium]
MLHVSPLVFSALLCLSLATPCARATPDPSAGDPTAAASDAGHADADARADPLRRVAVTGASVMAGFGLSHEIGRPLLYSDVVDAMLTGEHDPVMSFASDRLFLLSLASREALVTRLVEHRPSLVLAVDFLFWYGYGAVHDERSRPLLLEEGLRQLERLQCPVVVGDLPDMTLAVGRATYLGTALAPIQMPRAETLAAMNTRFAEWSASHPNVIVLPLADFVRRMFANEPFAVHGNAWPEGARDRILQGDWLHPTLLGSAALTALVFERVSAALGKRFDPARIDWDVPAVAARLDPYAPEVATSPGADVPAGTPATATPNGAAPADDG